MTSYFRDLAAPRPNVPRRIGVAALLERDGAVLVERRADNPAAEWAFVGGNVGDDEAFLDALRREVREETGFALAGASLFGVFSDPSRIVAYPDGNVAIVVSVVFRAVPEGDGPPRLSEESREMRFVAREELADLPMWPVHRPIRDAYLADPDGVVVA